MGSEMATKSSAGSPDTAVGDDEYARIVRLKKMGCKRRTVRRLHMMRRLRKGRCA
jgi:hypothetical protein